MASRNAKISVQWMFDRFKKMFNERYPNTPIQLETWNPGDGRRYAVTKDQGCSKLVDYMPAMEFKAYLDGACEAFRWQGDNLS